MAATKRSWPAGRGYRVSKQVTAAAAAGTAHPRRAAARPSAAACPLPRPMSSCYAMRHSSRVRRSGTISRTNASVVATMSTKTHACVQRGWRPRRRRGRRPRCRTCQWQRLWTRQTRHHPGRRHRRHRQWTRRCHHRRHHQSQTSRRHRRQQTRSCRRQSPCRSCGCRQQTRSCRPQSLRRSCGCRHHPSLSRRG